MQSLYDESDTDAHSQLVRWVPLPDDIPLIRILVQDNILLLPVRRVHRPDIISYRLFICIRHPARRTEDCAFGLGVWTADRASLFSASRQRYLHASRRVHNSANGEKVPVEPSSSSSSTTSLPTPHRLRINLETDASLSYRSHRQTGTPGQCQIIALTEFPSCQKSLTNHPVSVQLIISPRGSGYDDAHQMLPNRPVAHATAPAPRGIRGEFRVLTPLAIISQYSTDKTYTLKIAPVRRDLHWAIHAVFLSTLLSNRGLRMRIVKTNQYHKYMFRWIVKIVSPLHDGRSLDLSIQQYIRRGRRRVGRSDARGTILLVTVQTLCDVRVRPHLPGEPGERQHTACSRTLSTLFIHLRMDASNPEACSLVAKWTSLLTVPALS